MSAEKIIQHCFNRLIAQAKRPLFVALAGDSGSGKSYFTDLLVKKVKESGHKYTLINHDEFLISRKDREPMKSVFYQGGVFKGKSRWEILENMFRLDEFRRVIDELKAGHSTRYKPYSRQTGKVMNTFRTVEPADFIIFDTSMLLDEMDFVIVVDVTQENIIQRKLQRDSDVRKPKEIIDMHKQVQGYYWTDRGMPNNPDIVIDNNDFSNVKLIKL